MLPPGPDALLRALVRRRPLPLGALSTRRRHGALRHGAFDVLLSSPNSVRSVSFFFFSRPCAMLNALLARDGCVQARGSARSPAALLPAGGLPKLRAYM